ncbi:GAF domain-containing protein [Halogeometricum borinquense]|uniref:GAF domain-containing protein n=1 Tax=Halogeometricum borinquense TaxID=60847 RepID=A0A482TC86_9EURY|nr:helix-turn-helix domain-containing protein [Halogeometricum borinquense]RYJ08663.1 GAF domain-containing protein [Halogeometricum borinquense]
MTFRRGRYEERRNAGDNVQNTQSAHEREATYLADGIVEIDDNLVIVDADEKARARLEASGIPVGGLPVSDVFDFSTAVVTALKDGDRRDIYGDEFNTSIRYSKRENLPVTVTILPGTERSYLRLAIRDRTERHELQQRLSGLYNLARELLRERDDDRLAELALDAIVGDSNALSGRIYLADWDETERRSEVTLRAAATVGDEQPYPDPIERGESVIWEVLKLGQQRYRSLSADVSSEPDAAELFVPIGRYGVLVLRSSSEQITFEQHEHATSIVASLTAALETAGHERQLREQQAVLERQKRKLLTVARLNELLREVNRSIIGADRIDELLQCVVEQLSDTETYYASAFARYDPVSETLSYVTSSGALSFTDDEIALADETPLSDLGQRAIDRQSAVVAQNAASVEEWERIETTDTAAVESVAALPVVHHNLVYGVCYLFAETDSFTERELSVLNELSSMLGYAVISRLRRDLNQSGECIQLKVRVNDDTHPLVEVSRFDETDIVVDHIEFDHANGIQVYFDTAGERAERFLDELGEHDAVAGSEVVTNRRDGALVNLVLTDDLLTALISLDLHIASVKADEQGVIVTLTVPQNVSPRGILTALEEQFSDVSLVSRGRTPINGGTVGRMRSFVREALTDRQYEVLRCAFDNGYYDWPRNKSAKDVAEMLDISQPTFSQHLRAAEQKLLDQLFTPDEL